MSELYHSTSTYLDYIILEAIASYHLFDRTLPTACTRQDTEAVRQSCRSQKNSAAPVDADFLVVSSVRRFQEL